MPVVLVEGGYTNIDEVYMRKTKTSDAVREAGLGEDDWTLFDPDGRKCVCAFDRSALFFWAHEREIKVIVVQ